MNTILSIVLFVLFLYIVSNKKIPNSMLFMLMAPLMVLTGMMDASDVWNLFANTGIWLVMIIGVFAHLMDVSGFDEVIGDTFYKMTQPIKGKYRDLGIYAIIFVITALCSTLMSNVSVALAMVPAIYGISKKTGISRSKMVLNSFKIVKEIFPYFNAYIIGFLMLSGLYFLRFFEWKTLEKGFKIDYLFTTVGLLAVAKMISSSSIGDLITSVLGNTLSGNINPYFIQTVFFIMTVIITQFMNNMTACGVIAPIAIALAHSMGADPRAFVMAIAIGAGCGYLTPFASGTNQRMSVFSECTIVDYMRFGWPLVVINYACSIVILPKVFAFFP